MDDDHEDDTNGDPEVCASTISERAGEALVEAPPQGEIKRRLAIGEGGPEHMRAKRERQVRETKAAIEAAIYSLSLKEGKKGYPSAERIVEEGKGAFSRSRVFEHQELVDNAVAAWLKREALAGREHKPRVKRRSGNATSAVRSSSDEDPKVRLDRTIKAARGYKKDVERLQKENADLKRRNVRLGKGIHDEIWPTRVRETATFPGDPLDDDEADVEVDAAGMGA